MLTASQVSVYSYVAGAIAVLLSLVLFVLSATDKDGWVGYVVGGSVCLLVGAGALAMGAMASPKLKSAPPLTPSPEVDAEPAARAPPAPPPPEADPELREGSDDDDDGGANTEHSLTNYALAPAIRLDPVDPAPPAAPATPPATPPAAPAAQPARVRRAVGSGRPIRRDTSASAPSRAFAA